MTTAGPFFQTSTSGQVFVIDLCQPVGSLSDFQVMGQMDGVLTALDATQLTKVLVDFRQIPYFGSSLLEALRHIWNRVHAAQGRMVLCNTSAVGREILELAKFDQLWPIVADRQAGLELLAQ